MNAVAVYFKTGPVTDCAVDPGVPALFGLGAGVAGANGQDTITDGPVFRFSAYLHVQQRATAEADSGYLRAV
jgi:hypothetical protein